jgi:hypothetical protein
MYRKYKSNIYSNKSIKYNYITNSKTSNRTIVDDVKIRSEKLYNVSVSNKEKKEMNNRNNKYKITNEDFY